MPAKETFTSAKAPELITECVVAAFNGNARGFEWIQFDGAKSWKQGDRYVVSAATATPMYVLDVIPTGSGSIMEERSTLAGAVGPRYEARFRELIRGCL